MKVCSIDGCNSPAFCRSWCKKHYMRWWTHGNPATVLLVVAKAGAPQAFIDALPLEGEGCVTWPYAKNGEGYGQISVGDGKSALVSRVVCERENGPPPSSLHQAAHTCGNGHLSCIAPWHLEWKTPAENVADQLIHGTRSHGNHHAIKLTSDDVRHIRMVEGVSQDRLGEIYGVSQTMIGKIRRNKVWRAA